MKRVRYLAGAAGLAPMVLGAVAGGGAHAATADVTGHGKTVAPHAFWAGQRQIPFIGGVPCSYGRRNKEVSVVYSPSPHSRTRCFSGAGAEAVNISHFDWLETNQWKVFISLYYHGRSIGCIDSFHYTVLLASSCGGVPRGQGKVIYIELF